MKEVEKDDPNLFVADDEEPLGGFREVTISGRRAPTRSVHTGTVHKFVAGTHINDNWAEYIGRFPRSQGMKEKRKTQEERRTDENTKRENNPKLAQTFAKDHSTSALNTKALACATHIALGRKINERDYGTLIADRTFLHWSKMLAAYLRLMNFVHPDGSISIEELASYMLFARQLCHSYYDHPDTSELYGKYNSDHILIPNSFRPYGELVPFYTPLALALIYNDKNRFQMAVIRTGEYQTTMLPNPSDYEAFPSARDDDNRFLTWEDYAERRKQFKATFLYNIEDMVMVHLRAASGQTANQELSLGEKLTREYTQQNPRFRFLVHGTVFPAMNAIERDNLRPHARHTASKPRPPHFVPYELLSKGPEHI